jgi:hypothetical protein
MLVLSSLIIVRSPSIASPSSSSSWLICLEILFNKLVHCTFHLILIVCVFVIVSMISLISRGWWRRNPLILSLVSVKSRSFRSFRSFRPLIWLAFPLVLVILYLLSLIRLLTLILLSILERLRLSESLRRLIVRSFLVLIRSLIWVLVCILISESLISVGCRVKVIGILFKVALLSLLSERSLVRPWIFIVILVPSIRCVLLHLHWRWDMWRSLHIWRSVGSLIGLVGTLLERRPVRLPLEHLLEL